LEKDIKSVAGRITRVFPEWCDLLGGRWGKEDFGIETLAKMKAA